MIILTLIMLDCSIKIKIAMLQKVKQESRKFPSLSNEKKNIGLYEASFF